MPMPSRLVLLAALAALAACQSRETSVATPAASSVPPSAPRTPLTGALGAPIAPVPPMPQAADGTPLSGDSTAPAPVAMPGMPTRMSASEITAALTDNTVRGVTTEGSPYTMYFAGDGREHFRHADMSDTGTWRVLPDGRFCSSLNHLSADTQQCYIMYRNGQSITFQTPEGVTVGDVTVVPGNPE